MPSTPITGQISFNDVKSLASDKSGYTAPANVSLGTLAGVVRQFGQRAPGVDNIFFSQFYASTIAAYTISTTPIKYTKYGFGNRNLKNLVEGTITVSLKAKTFKKNTSNQGYVTVKITKDLTGREEIVYNQATYIDWNSGVGSIVYKTNYWGGKTVKTGPVSPLPGVEKHKVYVTDSNTGAAISTTSIVINTNGAATSYSINC